MKATFLKAFLMSLSIFDLPKNICGSYWGANCEITKRKLINNEWFSWWKRTEKKKIAWKLLKLIAMETSIWHRWVEKVYIYGKIYNLIAEKVHVEIILMALWVLKRCHSGNVILLVQVLWLKKQNPLRGLIKDKKTLQFEAHGCNNIVIEI